MTTDYRPEIIQSAFIDFLGSHLNRFWSLTVPRVRLIARHRLNDELIALEFEINQAFRRQAFVAKEDWQAGQYISLSVPIDGIYHQRTYSLVGLFQQPLDLKKSILQSAVDSNSINKKNSHYKNTFTIAVKPQGLVSNDLTRSAVLGTVYDSGLPEGNFTLDAMRNPFDQQSDKVPFLSKTSLLFIASGSGITPMLGLVIQALQRKHSVTLLYYHRHPVTRTPFLSYWQSLAANYQAFNYHIVSTSEAETYLANSRYLTSVSLLALQLPLEDIVIFACGSPSLLASLYQAADEIKLSNNESLKNYIITENFGTTAAINTTAQTNLDHVVNSKPQKIHIRNRQQQFTTDKTLLIGAEQAGVRLPFGCRQGICQLCRCQKVSGVVKNIQTGHVSTNGYESIQTCINIAVTDVVLEV